MINENEIKHAVNVLKAGGVVVYPTDTAYGLAVDATNKAAVDHLYQMKGRNFDKPIHVIFPSTDWLTENVKLNKTALKLMDKFMPGPLTIILPLKSQDETLKKISSPLGLGLRYPNNKIAQKLVKLLGRPITATSANLSGMQETYSMVEARRHFVSSKIQPDYYLDGGRLEKVKPSTIVSVENNNVKIIREGPISEIQIKKVLKK
jgi:L-threonylcarbamoyladenylate synthase